MSQRLSGFRAASAQALLDEPLQTALNQARHGFVDKRKDAVTALAEFEEIKARAKLIKDHALNHQGEYLVEFEAAVVASGGHVHWARNSAEANRIVLDICRQAKAKKVTKGKSMVSEEMGLNRALKAADLEVMETDLGEYIIQLAKEPPSHIIAPAVHKTKAEVEALFDTFHEERLPPNRSREQLVSEARAKLRAAFLSADVGITGANFLIAQTGSIALVTNEGNGDLTASLPNVHIVTTSIEKIIPKLEDLPTFLRLLGRSATGQEITAYTTLFTGPKHRNQSLGPEGFHVVLLDNGRSDIARNEYKDVLRCIRCGACINHCAVYGAVGGHAYQSVYPGPIGQAITPLLFGLDSSLETISACTMNGHCKKVCPMSIPLPDIIRKHRIQAFSQRKNAKIERIGLMGWSQLARFPRVYAALSRMGAKSLKFLEQRPYLQNYVPFMSNWKTGRSLMRASGETFQHKHAKTIKQRGSNEK